MNHVNDINDVEDVINKATDALENQFFIDGYINSGGSWLNKEYKDIKACLFNYLSKF